MRLADLLAWAVFSERLAFFIFLPILFIFLPILLFFRRLLLFSWGGAFFIFDFYLFLRRLFLGSSFMNILPEEEIPAHLLWPFAKKLCARYSRRAHWHDYRSRCFYMITITKAADCPHFSNISGSLTDRRFPPSVVLTETGRIVREQLYLLLKRFPVLEISLFVIMPDHIHFLIFIKERSDELLGKYINTYKGGCTLALREAIHNPNVKCFDERFHDRIVRREGQLAKIKNYIADNPRRLLIKRTYPNLFTRRYEITIEGIAYEAIGNLFLLRNPEIAAVRISSKYSDNEKEKLHKR